MQNKKALKTESQNQSSNSSLAQWQKLCKQAFDEISAMCENGSERELLLLINEVKSEKTNNKSDLQRLERAYKERFAVWKQLI